MRLDTEISSNPLLREILLDVQNIESPKIEI